MLLVVLSTLFVFGFSSAPVSRIIGGTIVTLGVDPSINYQVGVVSSSRRCGGSIIGQQHVLTAAHCLIEQNGANSRLLQPVTDLRVIPGTSINGGTSFRVSAIYVNPSFTSSNNLENDVAVLRISGNFTFGTSVGTVGLATATNCANCYDAGTPLIVSGYGFTISDASGQSGLPGDPGVSPNLRRFAGELCAGPVTGNSGQDSCGGDSGGPLVFDSGAGNNPRYLQVGVVSSGTAPLNSNPACGGANDYGIYTRVSFYTAFIDSAMRGSIPPTASWATVVIPNVILLILVALL